MCILKMLKQKRIVKIKYWSWKDGEYAMNLTKEYDIEKLILINYYILDIYLIINLGWNWYKNLIWIWEIRAKIF